MVFSVLATIILQEMSARLGIITRNGLGEALRIHFSRPAPRIITAILVISAITIGNAAFQTGNILGASLGLQTLFGRDAFTEVLGGTDRDRRFHPSYGRKLQAHRKNSDSTGDSHEHYVHYDRNNNFT